MIQQGFNFDATEVLVVVRYKTCNYYLVNIGLPTDIWVPTQHVFKLSWVDKRKRTAELTMPNWYVTDEGLK